MGSFNTFTQKSFQIGDATPVWLGVVSPLPKGGVLASKFAVAGAYIPAGTPISLSSGTIKPLAIWQVVSVNSSTHAITIIPLSGNILPAANDFVTPIGATFATTGAAGKVSSIVADSTDGQYVVTFTDAKLDGVSTSSYLTFSGATAVATSGASILVTPNAYLYNDIHIDVEVNGESNVTIAASGAAVVAHNEGILIARTPANAVKALMATAVPNVIQVEE